MYEVSPIVYAYRFVQFLAQAWKAQREECRKAVFRFNVASTTAMWEFVVNSSYVLNRKY